MKVFKAILFIFLSTSAIFAKSADPVTNDPGKKARLTSSAISSDIFFEDFSSGTIFIDFEGLKAPLASISIFKKDRIMFSDPVSDLPLNTIYELNTELMRSGDYTIELESVDGHKIQRDIWVE